MGATSCKNNLLNCWNAAKPPLPQRRDETGSDVTDEKEDGAVISNEAPNRGTLRD